MSTLVHVMTWCREALIKSIFDQVLWRPMTSLGHTELPMCCWVQMPRDEQNMLNCKNINKIRLIKICVLTSQTYSCGLSPVIRDTVGNQLPSTQLPSEWRRRRAVKNNNRRYLYFKVFPTRETCTTDRWTLAATIWSEVESIIAVFSTQ